MIVSKTNGASTRAIVHAAAGLHKFTLSRFEPEPALRPFVEQYWTVRYDLRGEPAFTQTVLSYPNVQLAFEQDESGRRALLYGVPKQPFVRELRGAGRVFGVKFRAGGFYPYWRRDVALLTGTTVAASTLFGRGVDDWADAVLDAGDDAGMLRLVEQGMLERLPDRDPQAERASHIVSVTMDDRSIQKVEHMSERTGLSIRALQRLFRTYVGVTPKWVIKRFRLQEAAERLERDDATELAELASELGYYDQAHFVKDFKSVLGRSPAAYQNITSNGVGKAR